jgi:arylsulfatase A-like enzyme
MLRLLCALVLVGSLGATTGDRPTGTPPNILLITLDDVGIDRFPSYGVHPVPVRMPVMEQLIAGGVTFDRVWAMPSCSPTRASLLTGRFPSRHGIMNQIGPGDPTEPQLDPAEITIPKVLPAYRSAVIGKWHLRSAGNPTTHPLACGFTHHLGSMYNVGANGYFHWRRYVDGNFAIETRYATTVTTTDALRLTQLLPQPWFLFVNYNAAHAPFHVPPPHLHTYGSPGDEITQFRAMLEAMDTEIGRMLAGVDLDTTLVVVLGDNGTPRPVTDGPWSQDHAKGSLYEGGVRVPMVVHGPGVGQGRSDALISVVDIHRTLVEWVGGNFQAQDSISFVPQLLDPSTPGARQYLFAEKSNDQAGGATGPGHQRAISDGRWKLISDNFGQQFFDLSVDLVEVNNLLQAPLSAEAQVAYDDLLQALTTFP